MGNPSHFALNASIPFNTKLSRTIPNPWFTNQNLLISKGRVLRILWRWSGENCHESSL
jgi:hypothetical protein